MAKRRFSSRQLMLLMAAYSLALGSDYHSPWFLIDRVEDELEARNLAGNGYLKLRHTMGGRYVFRITRKGKRTIKDILIHD